MSWSQLGDLAAAVGPWFVLALIVLFLAWAFCFVRMVLKNCGTKTTDGDVTITVRPFPWPHVTVEIKRSAPTEPDKADQVPPPVEASQPTALPAAAVAQPATLPDPGTAQQPANPTA